MPTPMGPQRVPARVMSMATRTMVTRTETTDMEDTGTATGVMGTLTAPEEEA